MKRRQAEASEDNLEEGGRSDGIASPASALGTALLAQAPLPVACFDAMLRCVFVNDAFVRVVAKSHDALLGQPASEILPFPSAVVLPELRRALAMGKPVTQEMTGMAVGTSPVRRLWSVDVQPILPPAADETADVAGVGVFLTEITERRKTEALARDALQRLAFHVENTPLAVIEWDDQFRVLLWSERAEAMFGWKAAEVVGKHPDEWPFIYADDVATVTRTVEDLLGGVLRNVSNNRNWTKDGRLVFCEWYNSALRDRDGAILSILSLVQDVTEQRDAARRQRRFFREMLESLTEGRLCLCDAQEDLPAPLPQVGETIALAPRTLRQVRRAVDSAAQTAFLPSGRASELTTAVSEAAMNAVVHAGGGEAKVCVSPEQGAVQVWIADYGSGIKEDALHRATLEKGYTTAGTLGHGFWMMLKTADRVYLLTGPNGTTVVIEQSRVPADPAWLRARLAMTDPLTK